ILSDTHDNVANIVAALELLAPHNPAAYIHCGDVCAPEILVHFAGLPLYFVFGNCDYDHASLKAEARACGLHCMGKFGELTLANKSIAVLHGDDWERLPAKKYDYVFSGHTHVQADRRANGARMINPGALHRASMKSVALLDLVTDRLEILAVVG